jgi:hypothetical protein
MDVSPASRRPFQASVDREVTAADVVADYRFAADV